MKTTFMDRKNRDNEFWNIPKSERWQYNRRSLRNQQLHPMYVDDYTAVTGKVLTQQDKGFGNTIYRTHFNVLYIIDKVR